MKLTDQEQVVLKAIGHGVVQVSQVIRAVGYPKAMVKKVLARLNEKGIVALHRHDYPQSLKPEQRKLMLRLRDGQGNWQYYSAVSVMKRNPKGKHLPGLPAKKQRQYEHILESAKKYHRYGKRKKEVAARTVKARAKNKSGKSGQALKTTGRALKSAARGILGAGSQILGAGAKALNPVRRKVRNKYIDLIIKGQAKKTPDGWRVGKKTFAQGRGTVNVSSGYYLDRHTGLVYAKRERNMAKKRRRRNIEMGFYDATGFHPIRASSDYSEGQRPSRSRRAKTRKRKASATASHRRKVASRKRTTKSLVGRSLRRTTSTGRRLKRRRNIEQGFYDASGGFHPIRASSDYSPSAAGETGGKVKRTRSKKRISAKRKASSTARTRSRVRTRKATTSRLAGRSLKKSSGLLKSKKRGRKNPTPSVLALVNRTDSKAAQNRREFAGVYRRDTPLRYPEGTPQGLSKLGRLIKIKTDRATITPVDSHTWLVRDLKGKLHIGTTNKDGVIWEGPTENFGKVKQIEYEDVKRHLGHNRLTGFFHFMGEETGHRPTLHADGKGGLKFHGGAYQITSRGIEN